jgi:hypothetical protein
MNQVCDKSWRLVVKHNVKVCFGRMA